MHPDVSRLTFRFGRWHHFVDYRPFRGNRLVLKADAELNADPEYGLRIVNAGGE
jgi:hypothetical protein